MALRDEILEQPAAAARLLNTTDASFAPVREMLARRRPRFAVIAARGSSDNAALYAQYLFGIRNRLAVALATPRLYRLPITLKVSGTYEELHMLLTQIERHAEALQWSQLTLDSSNWPAIQLTLKAHVLSPEPRWGAAS